MRPALKIGSRMLIGQEGTSHMPLLAMLDPNAFSMNVEQGWLDEANYWHIFNREATDLPTPSNMPSAFEQPGGSDTIAVTGKDPSFYSTKSLFLEKSQKKRLRRLKEAGLVIHATESENIPSIREKGLTHGWFSDIPEYAKDAFIITNKKNLKNKRVENAGSSLRHKQRNWYIPKNGKGKPYNQWTPNLEAEKLYTADAGVKNIRRLDKSVSLSLRPRGSAILAGQKWYKFHIHHPEHENPIGEIAVNHEEAKNNIDVVYAHLHPEHRQKHSLKGMITGLKEHFPTAKTISGFRVSGRHRGEFNYPIDKIGNTKKSLFLAKGIFGSKLTKIPRMAGLKLKTNKDAYDDVDYSLRKVDKMAGQTDPNKHDNLLTMPNKRARSRVVPRFSTLLAAHEVGHHMRGHTLGTEPQNENEQGIFHAKKDIRKEREAWASGVSWLRNQGYKPKLEHLQDAKRKTLSTYGGIVASGKLGDRKKEWKKYHDYMDTFKSLFLEKGIFGSGLTKIPRVHGLRLHTKNEGIFGAWNNAGKRKGQSGGFAISRTTPEHIKFSRTGTPKNFNAAISRPKKLPQAKKQTALVMAHEVGHYLRGHQDKGVQENEARRAGNSTLGWDARHIQQGTDEINKERQAWAAGISWMRNQGYRPKLHDVKRISNYALGTYGKGNFKNPKSASGTPRERKQAVEDYRNRRSISVQTKKPSLWGRFKGMLGFKSMVFSQVGEPLAKDRKLKPVPVDESKFHGLQLWPDKIKTREYNYQPPEPGWNDTSGIHYNPDLMKYDRGKTSFLHEVGHHVLGHDVTELDHPAKVGPKGLPVRLQQERDATAFELKTARKMGIDPREAKHKRYLGTYERHFKKKGRLNKSEQDDVETAKKHYKVHAIRYKGHVFPGSETARTHSDIVEQRLPHIKDWHMNTGHGDTNRSSLPEIEHGFVTHNNEFHLWKKAQDTLHEAGVDPSNTSFALHKFRPGWSVNKSLFLAKGIFGSKLTKIPRVEGVKLRTNPFAKDPYEWRIFDNSTKKRSGAVITPPNKKARKKAPKYVTPYAIGHEVGHHLRGHNDMDVERKEGESQNKQTVRHEREAWATGLTWLKKQGFKPKLKEYNKIKAKTLATYNRQNLWDKTMDNRATGTPRQRAAFKSLYLEKAHKLDYRTTFQGLPISIETRRGAFRSWKDHKGHEGRTKMKFPYGYIRRTEGADGDHVDCFVGKNPFAQHAYIIRQVIPDTGEYDEDKVMLGFDCAQDAQDAYLEHYNSNKFYGKMDMMPMHEFSQKVFQTKDNPGMVK